MRACLRCGLSGCFGRACPGNFLEAVWKAELIDEVAFEEGDVHGREVFGCGVAGFDYLIFLQFA